MKIVTLCTIIISVDIRIHFERIHIFNIMKKIKKAVSGALALCFVAAALSSCNNTTDPGTSTGLPGVDSRTPSQSGVTPPDITHPGDGTTSDTGNIIITPPTTSPQPPETSAPQKKHKVEQIDGIWYVDGVLIVNKTYPLPSDYNPGKILLEASIAFAEMQNAAKNDGIRLTIVSGFRSYSRQNTLYNNYAAKDGKAEADRYSARPGHSEHQTGLAMDLNSVDDSFAYTKEAKWIAENCARFGFIIRYPKGKEDVTGYIYEPWHVRYLGVDLAEKITASGLTLEEYFGITSSYNDRPQGT